MKMSATTVGYLLLGIAAGISVIVTVYFISNGQALLYRDAKSHLNIARRVMSSKTPGLAQLGGIWLPMPHIYMLPMIWQERMYYSGLAGIIPSMISFVLLVALTYAMVLQITKSVVSAIIASVVILLNPSLLYLQSTPMSELPLLAASAASVYFFLKWMSSSQFNNIVASAFFVFLATLTRYDGWFLFACELLTIFIIGLIRRKEKNKEHTGAGFLFFCLGGFGIFLWGIYNKLIFGNFLNFALGQGSGAWDTQRVASFITVSPKGNILFSLQTYSWLVYDTVGPFLLIGTLLAVVLFPLLTKNRRWFPVYILLASPFLFNIISLFFGLSIAQSSHLPPFETYNLRYGSAVIPSIAVLIGILAGYGNIGKYVSIAFVVCQIGSYYLAPFPILADANVGNVPSEVLAAAWIAGHPAKGDTLVSTLAHDPLVFMGNIPMEKVVYEGNQFLWPSALSYPEGSVARVILKVSDTTNDMVRKRLYGKPVLREKYQLVYDDDYQVYDQISPP